MMNFQETSFLNNDYETKVTIEVDRKFHTFSNATSAFEALRCPSLVEQMEHLNAAGARMLRNKNKDAQRPNWSSMQIKAMEQVVTAKFQQNDELRNQLLKIDGEIQFQPEHYKDGFWGISEQGGQNNLGKVLAVVRDSFREQESTITEDLKSHTFSYRVAHNQQLNENDTIAGRTVRSYRAEVYYAQAILDTNKVLKENGLPLITTSEARALHNEFKKNLIDGRIQLNSTISTINNSGDILNCIRKTLLEQTFTEHRINRELLLKALPAGIENIYDRAINNALSYELEPNGKFKKFAEVPLSPYDDEHCMNEVFLEYGGRILYAEADQMELQNEKTHEYLKNFPVAYRDDDKIKKFCTVNNKTCVYQTRTDARGLSYLKSYMEDQSELEKVTGNFDGMESRVSAEMLEKAKNIIMELKVHGYDMSFMSGTDKGQLDVAVEGTPYTVRIIDVSDKQYTSNHEWNPSMVGRVYNSKTATTVYNTGGFNDLKAKGQVIFPNIKGSELWPISYMMGWEIKDENGNILNKKADINETEKNKIFYTSNKGHTVRLMDSSSGLVTADNVGIHSVCNRVFKKEDESVEPEVGLKNAVETARARFEEMVDVNGLIKQFNDHKDDTNYNPVLSSDERIEEIQTQYWDLLKGGLSTLIRPGKEEEFRELNAGKEVDDEINDGIDALFSDIEIEDKTTFNADKMSKEEIVKAHLKEYIEENIGTFEPSKNGKRFNPVLVKDYMDSELSGFSKNDRLSDWIGKCQIGSDELRGENDFFKSSLINRGIQFHEDNFKPLSVVAKDSEVMAKVNAEVRNTILSSGCVLVSDDAIKIDDQGVIKYTAYRISRERISTSGSPYNSISEAISDWESSDSVRREKASHLIGKVEGYVGPVFDYDKEATARDEKVVVVKYAGSEPLAFVPHMEAYVLPKDLNKGNETLTMTERTVVVPYEKRLCDTIGQTIRNDIVSAKGFSNETLVVGRPSNIIGLYGNLYKENLPSVDYYDYYRKFGKTDEQIHLTIKELGSKFKYGKQYAEHAGTREKVGYEALLKRRGEMNDNFQNIFRDCDYTEITAIHEEAYGYVDPEDTGVAKNQGVTRTLVEGARISDSYRIIPARNEDDTINKNARSVASNSKYFKYTEYDGAERQAPAHVNFVHELQIVEHVGTAQITLGGWTQDDAIVVSKEFAEKHKVPVAGDSGKQRSLKRGDKLSDVHSNKGVISLVVDRNMSLEEARKQGIEEIVKIFKDNPDLDVVTSPYSIVSRMNGGTYVEANASETKPLIYNGQEHPDKLGFLSFHILKQTVDVKSKNENALRKAGAQAMWGIIENGGDEIIKDLYKNNDRGFRDFRDILNVVGRDITPDGTQIVRGYAEHPNEQRKVFNVPSYSEIYHEGNKLKDDIGMQVKKFSNKIANSGGVLTLPFDLPIVGDEINGKKQAGLAKGANGWLLPIMSSKLRAGTELYDEEILSHDFTHYYEKIYESALSYNVWMEAKKQATMPNNESIRKTEKEALRATLAKQNGDQLVDDKLIEKAYIEKKVRESYESCKSTYLVFQREILSTYLNGAYKHNVYKEMLMSKRQAKSATLVLSPDPRLSTEECAMNKATAKALGLIDSKTNQLKADASVLVSRDPVLRAGAFRNLKVTIDSSLTGIAVAPHALACADADFDGDTLGVWALQSVEAKKQAELLFSPHANMLDYSAKPERVPMVNPKDRKPMLDADGKQKELDTYPLFFKDGLDLAAGEGAKPELKEKIKQITYEANYYESMFARQAEYVKLHPEFKFDPRFKDAEQIDLIRKGVMQKYDDYCHEAFEASVGRHALSYGSINDHIQSIKETIDDGCKGSLDKAADYIKESLGIDVTKLTDENGKTVDLKSENDFKKLYDEGVKTGFGSDSIIQRQIAANAKTGFAGDVGHTSQELFTSLGPDNSNIALELSQPVQQSLMQAKKSAPEALRKVNNIASAEAPLKALFNGEMIAKYRVDENGNIGEMMNSKDPSFGVWKPVKEHAKKFGRENSNFVMEKRVSMTTNQFETVMNDFFTDEFGMNVKVNPNFVHELASELGKPWYEQRGVQMIEHKDQVQSLRNFAKNNPDASMLHKLAYGVEDIMALTKNGPVELFNQPILEGFIPQSLRENGEAIKANQLEKVKPLIADDQKSTFKASYKHVIGVVNKEKQNNEDVPILDDSSFGMSM